MDAPTRFFMDPLVKPEDDEKEVKPDDDEGVVWFYYESTIFTSRSSSLGSLSSP